MEFLSLLSELKLIVIDYLGENKYQLNYKKLIEEYKCSYRWDYSVNFGRLFDNYNEIEPNNWKIYCYRNIQNIDYGVIYNQKSVIVANLPEIY